MNKKSNNTEILNEFIRCIKDKNYFINKYVKVEKPKTSKKIVTG